MEEALTINKVNNLYVPIFITWKIESFHDLSQVPHDLTRSAYSSKYLHNYISVLAKLCEIQSTQNAS